MADELAVFGPAQFIDRRQIDARPGVDEETASGENSTR